MQKYTFHVVGMHCASCVILTESELQNIAGVTRVKADLKNNSVEIEGNFNTLDRAAIRKLLSKSIESYGYSLAETPEITNTTSGYVSSLFSAIILFAIFIALQKLGLVNIVNASEINYSTAFVIGLVASLSSCMAVVGGLALSLSATYAKQGTNRPHYFFHAGRLIGFFIFGGLLGLLGSAFQLGAIGSSILNLLVAAIMIILALNLLQIWRKQLSWPKSLGLTLMKLRNLNFSIVPFVLGALTFFLPCGFTQSMQLFALTTHDYWIASGLMLAFALGTLPVLGLISFGSSSIEYIKKYSNSIFKTMGFLVLLFAIFNILNSLAAIGIIPPILNF